MTASSLRRALVAAALCLPVAASAQDNPPDAAALAKKLANPIASLISVSITTKATGPAMAAAGISVFSP